MNKSKIQILFSTLLISVLLTCHSSCSNKRSKKSIYKAYNQEQYLAILEKDSSAEIKVIDTHCINDLSRAKSDLRKGMRKFYCDSFDYGFSEKQIVLGQLGIQVGHMSIGCGYGNIPGFNHLCYEYEMIQDIYDKYRNKFIDSLLIEAERQFAQKNPDSLYIREGEDLRKLYLKE